MFVDLFVDVDLFFRFSFVCLFVFVFCPCACISTVLCVITQIFVCTLLVEAYNKDVLGCNLFVCVLCALDIKLIALILFLEDNDFYSIHCVNTCDPRRRRKYLYICQFVCRSSLNNCK